MPHPAQATAQATPDGCRLPTQLIATVSGGTLPTRCADWSTQVKLRRISMARPQPRSSAAQRAATLLSRPASRAMQRCSCGARRSRCPCLTPQFQVSSVEAELPPANCVVHPAARICQRIGTRPLHISISALGIAQRLNARSASDVRKFQHTQSPTQINRRV